MHDTMIEELLRTRLRAEANDLPFSITAAELERRLAARRRAVTGQRLSLVAAVVAVIAVGALVSSANGWLRLPAVGANPSPTESEDPAPSGAPSPSVAIPSPAASLPAAAETPRANPIEATAERDGIALTLALERDRVPAGDPLRFVVSVVNDGPNIAFWAGSDCDLVTAVRVEGPPAPTERPGRSWDGDAGVLKMVSLSSDRPMNAALTVDQWQLGSWGCDSMYVVSEIPSGGKLELPGVWPATTSFGAPVPGGEYRAIARFGLLGRQPSGPFVGSSPEDAVPVEVTVPLVVAPVEGPSLSAGEAMDAVLSDSPFEAWLKSVTRERWEGSDLRYDNGQWVFVLRFDTGRAEVRIDAASGRIVDRTLP